MPRRIQPCWHWCDGTLLRIPESLSDITSAWITGALRSAGHVAAGTATVSAIQPIGAELGFASQVGRVHLAFDSPTRLLPSSMVAKLAAPRKHDTWNQFIEEKYGREWLFYSQVGPDAGVRTPVCYFCAHDPVSRRIVLLLEDLGGARFGDAATAWSRRDAETVVDALAGLHARWWNDQKLAQWAWLPPYGDVEAQMEKLADRRAVFLERYREEISPGFRHLVTGLGRQHAERLHQLSGHPTTLLHGDVHLDNIAFLDEPAAAPVLFDWQCVAKGQSVVDLALFLTTGSSDGRRTCERALIERYHGRLVAGGVTGYSLEILMADYQVALLRWLIGTIN
jgi:hypothetical protein